MLSTIMHELITRCDGPERGTADVLTMDRLHHIKPENTVIKIY